MQAAKPQYQHYIPQFILKNFGHPFVCPNTPNNSSKCKKRHHEKDKYPGDQVVDCLQLLPDGFKIETHPIRRICGLYDMYTDQTPTAAFPHQLETKFSQLERRASGIFRKIIKSHEHSQSYFELNRTQRDILRKFLFLQTYRGSQYFQRYNCETIEDYDINDRALLKDFMDRHGIQRPIDVWLHGLSAIINLEMDVGDEWAKEIKSNTYLAISEAFLDHVANFWIALCTPLSEDEEFVLTDTGYNIHEGPIEHFENSSTGEHLRMGPRFHYFATIAPRLMIVLRSKYLPESREDRNLEVKAQRELKWQISIDLMYGQGTGSILEDLPVHKALPNYLREVDGRLEPKPGWDKQYRKSDRFKFPFFKIGTHHVHIMNGLLLDHAFHGSTVIFKRKTVFLDLVEWYLTEPCKVGKNLSGEHRKDQQRYIEQLTAFLRAEGREVSAKATFYLTRHDLDIEQFRQENIDAARLLEELYGDESSGLGQPLTEAEQIHENESRQGFKENLENRPDRRHRDAEKQQLESEPTVKYESISEESFLDAEISERFMDLARASLSKHGVTPHTLANDQYLSLVMICVWLRNAEMDRLDGVMTGNRLESLLNRHLQQPNTVFWLFLKQIRLAIWRREQLSRFTNEKSLFNENDWAGPEDDIRDEKAVPEPYDLNVEMWRAMTHDISKSRELEHEMSPVELTCLCLVRNDFEQIYDAFHRHLRELSRAARAQEEKLQKVETERNLPAEFSLWNIVFVGLLIIMLLLGGIIFWM